MPSLALGFDQARCWTDIALGSSWLALVLWLITRAVRQRNLFGHLSPAHRGTDRRLPTLGVIVPARDECENIGPCLSSLLAQVPAPEQLQVVAVNDHSGDGTEKVMASLAAEDARLTVIQAPTLPPGWTGKTYACSVGAAIIPAHVQWLCFMDADVRAHPRLLASALQCAVAENLALLTLAPRQELRSFAERLILPCGLYLLGFCQDLHRIQKADSAEVVATGQFMLMRHDVYAELGGHTSVRRSICEDLDLARLFKQAGHRVLMQDGSALLTTRMYTGWRTLWAGIAKNLTQMLGGPRRTAITALLAVVIAWTAALLPVMFAIDCSQDSIGACVALVPATLGTAAILGLHLAGAVHFGIPIGYGLLFPLGYSIGAVIALDSIRWRLTGRVRWKGRLCP